MALTREFKKTIQERAERDPEFRAELLIGALKDLLAGDVDSGLALLRDYINARVGFNDLASITGKSPKTLMRMFGPNGNPVASNLFPILSHLARHEGVSFKLNLQRGKYDRDGV